MLRQRIKSVAALWFLAREPARTPSEGWSARRQRNCWCCTGDPRRCWPRLAATIAAGGGALERESGAGRAERRPQVAATLQAAGGKCSAGWNAACLGSPRYPPAPQVAIPIGLWAHCAAAATAGGRGPGQRHTQPHTRGAHRAAGSGRGLPVPGARRASCPASAARRLRSGQPGAAFARAPKSAPARPGEARARSESS